MRNICAAVLSVALITSSAFAASDKNTTLAPGKPAGVKAAQGGDSTVLFVAGGIALAGVIALGLANNNNNGAGNNNVGGSPTTTGTL